MHEAIRENSSSNSIKIQLALQLAQSYQRVVLRNTHAALNANNSVLSLRIKVITSILDGQSIFGK
jgi:hypothetical protein